MFDRSDHFTCVIIIMTKVYGRKTVHNVIPPEFVMGHRKEPSCWWLFACRQRECNSVRSVAHEVAEP